MKNFNRNLIAGGMTLVLLTTGASAFAKGGEGEGNYRDSRGMNTDYIYAQLSLSEDQIAEVTDILDTFAEENRDAMRGAMQSLRDSEQRPSREEMDTIREQNRTAHSEALLNELTQVLSAQQANEMIDYMDAHRPVGMMADRGDRNSNDHRQQGRFSD